MSVKKSDLCSRDSIFEEIRPIYCSNTDYISENGNVYKEYGEDKFYKKACRTNDRNGYVYCHVTQKDGKNKGMRVHRLVAVAFVKNDNPDDFIIVGHINNIKHDNHYSNLYWTTTQENTKKAFDDGLNVQPIGIHNENSQPILATTLDGSPVGIYGSLRQCCRCIKNLDITYLLKILDKTGNYKPRNKNYKYIKITKEEYLSYPNYLIDVQLDECEKKKKQMRIFKAINTVSGEEYISDNQKQFGKDHGIHQACISSCLINGVSHGDWIFEVIDEISYTQSSAHNNLLELSCNPVVKNTIDGTTLNFKSIKELTLHFGLGGHGGISQYINKGNLIHSKWEVIGW